MSQDLQSLLEPVASLISAGRLAEAANQLQVLCKSHPHIHRLKYQLGTVFYHLDQFESAFDFYLQACLGDALQADFHLALALGLTAFRLKRFDQALISFFRASVLDAENMEAVVNMGACYFESDDFERARRCFELASNRQSDPSQALLNLGVCLGRLNQHQAALEVYDRLLCRGSVEAKVHAFRGVALHRLGDSDSAILSYQNALSIDASCAPAYLNWGITCMAQEEMTQAVSHLRRALSLSGNGAEARWNLSMALLSLGQYEEGFELYNARLELMQRKLFRTDPGTTAPLLVRGAALAGKTIYVFDEQGLGDCIQFARYLPMLKNAGASVVARISGSLISLLKPSNAVDVWVGDHEPIPLHDAQIPLMSLPGFFNTTPETVPAAAGYLKPEAHRQEHWSQRLVNDKTGGHSRMRIGLMWAGNPMNPNDARRSISLVQLLSFLPEAESSIQWVALTNAMSVDDEKRLAEDGRVVNLCREINDFSDTAALISLCDRIVTVDTSVAHLAGAMGVPTDLLISRAPDWRWGLTGEKTPWYGSVKLHRQIMKGDWDTILKSVFADILSIL